MVELVAKGMNLDTTIPENPYTKYQEQDVIVCDPICRPAAVKQKGKASGDRGERSKIAKPPL